MADDEQLAALREELLLLDEEIGELRRTVTDLRQGIGGRSDGPADATDVAAAITAAEEQEAFLAVLEARREELRKRLGDA